MRFMRSDAYYMKRALALARRGQGLVSPNPMVGAVVVSPRGEILSEGYHARFGGPHAERVALEKLNYSAEGCTLYVNLEPCCHHGKTPPCTDAILEAGIKRVVVGTLDPNPQVAGAGVRLLEEHGVEVKVGVLEDVCLRLNRGFFKWIRTKRPYVILKWAQSIDGRIAARSGDSKWISGERALHYAHRLRAFCDAVLVGLGTVLADDPQLTVRRCPGVDPLRVVLDEYLEAPLDRKVFSTPPKTLVFTCRSDAEKERALADAGVRVERVSRGEGGVCLEEVLERLGAMGVTTLLVEGGSRVHSSFIRLFLFDEIQAIVAPRILGDGVGCVGGFGFDRVSDAMRLSLEARRGLGEDTLLVATFHQA